MWTRGMLKFHARRYLEHSYWTAFAVALIFAVCMPPFFLGFSRGRGIGGVLLSIFIFMPFEVGVQRFYVQSVLRPDCDIGEVFYAFRGSRYLNVVGALLLRSVLVFLWTLLLIVPGIVKHLAYSMAPYILSENPNIGASRALELSEQMTHGYKWDILLVSLSFIGWYLLGSLALCIGVLFVNPYYLATKAQLYLALRQNALESGITSLRELSEA